MSKIAIIGAGGVGDCILSRQCGFYAERYGCQISYFYPVRNEIFAPFSSLFPDSIQIEEFYDEGNKFTENIELVKQFTEQYGEFDDIYWIVPSLLYQNKYAFNYQKFNVSPGAIASTRLLTHLRTPKKIIFASLNSPLRDYQLGSRIKPILTQLANQNPTYKIFYNNLTEWASKKLNNGDLSGLPDNVLLFNDLSFVESLEYLKKASYLVTVDCGVFHVGKQLGIDTLLLDTRLTNNGLPWIPRWRSYGLSDSIPNETDSVTIAGIVKTNLENPVTTLLPRQIIAQNIGINWNQVLLIP